MTSLSYLDPEITPLVPVLKSYWLTIHVSLEAGSYGFLMLGAIVDILVYAFILHMRLIPKMQSLYAYNLASLFGWASVIMTYYGVNYYLSGLHSYAAGDPIPIPSWVYIVVIVMIFISILAFWRKKKFNIF